MNLPKIELALQTPTVTLTVTAKDAANNTESWKAEFKRYDIKTTKQKLKEFEDIASTPENFKELSQEQQEEELEQQDERFKAFVRKELVTFKQIKWFAGGKLIATIKDTSDCKDIEQLKAIPDVTSVWFDIYWNSAPHKAALIDTMFLAIRNTAAK